MMGPYDHRGRPVGNPNTSHGGHLPAPRKHPRVVKNMSRLYNISSDDAQSVVDLHKNKSDIGEYGLEPGDSELIQKLGTQNPSEAIMDTFYSRRKKDGSQDNTDYTPRTDPYGRGI